MGRILKKKSATKKKKPSEDAASVEAGNGSALNPSGSAAAPEVKRRPASLQKKAAGTAKSPGDRNWIGKSIQFLREVKAELKKVTWPSKKQTLGSTAVVIIVVMVISFFLGVVDLGLSSLMRAVLQ